jgi:hypothetical protein
LQASIQNCLMLERKDRGMTSEQIYLRLNGIPSDTPPKNGETYFIPDMQGGWCINEGNLLYNIERACLKLHQAIARSIFNDLNTYYAFLRGAPSFLYDAGLNSESSVSRKDFEELLLACKNFPYLNQFLYLYDVRKLVSGIQEGSKETIYLLGEFYRAFNMDELFYPPIKEEDGIRYLTSPVVTKIFAMMNFVFIRMHSLLDYTTKLAYEVDRFRKDFNKYPKLSSSGIQFAHQKRTSLRDADGTLFEDCELIKEVELIRNFIIHDGFMDDMPKIYKVVKAGKAVEKYILMPDRNQKTGQLEKYSNRTLFYGGEDKINLRLPKLLTEFQERQVITLNLILEKLN